MTGRLFLVAALALSLVAGDALAGAKRMQLASSMGGGGGGGGGARKAPDPGRQELPAGGAKLKVPAVLPPKGPQPITGTGAIVLPRENCGTFWTDWEKDSNANVNPCPANCERGERLDVRERKTGDGARYQANYRCSLPELVVNPPPAAAREPGVPPRTNCGTFWTSRQSVPNADVNPCPANCERGELLDVRRGRSGDKLYYEMNYRCYMGLRR